MIIENKNHFTDEPNQKKMERQIILRERETKKRYREKIELTIVSGLERESE